MSLAIYSRRIDFMARVFCGSEIGEAKRTVPKCPPPKTFLKLYTDRTSVEEKVFEMLSNALSFWLAYTIVFYRF